MVVFHKNLNSTAIHAWRIVSRFCRLAALASPRPGSAPNERKSLSMRFSALSSKIQKLLLAGSVSILALGSAVARAQDEIPNAARLGFVSGAVSVQPAGVDAWGEAYPNLPLGPGDRVFTADNSRAEIQIGQTFVRIGPNSDITFVNDSPEAIVFGLAQGGIHIHAFGLWPDQTVQVNTPSGNSTIMNPGEYRADVILDQGATLFASYGAQEQVNWVGGDGPETRYVEYSRVIELVGSNPAAMYWLAPNPPDDLDLWSQSRDAAFANAVTFRYVSPYTPGAVELDAAGDWQPGTPYGPVWFPRGVPGGWAPYHYGHWVNHAPWGWMWVEDEQWGYAPFHYGRWVSIGGRWGWVPGPPEARPIFSPALVVFAGGVQVGGAGVSVWFPLGPGEPYRPWYPCPPHYIDEVNISNIRPTAVIHVQTTYVNIVNVTNVTNITYVNRTIGVTAMSQNDFAAGRPVAQAAVHIDPQQMQHVTVVSEVQVRPAPSAMVGRPPARTVPVKTERPALINAQGKLAVAKPGARPVDPPVKPAPAARPLPGRSIVAESPSARTGGGKPSPAPVAKPMPAPAARPAEPQPPKPHSEERTAPPKPEEKAAPEKPAAEPAHPEANRPAHETPEAKPEAHPAAPADKPETAAPPKPEDKTKPPAKPADKNKKPPEKKPEEQKPE